MNEKKPVYNEYEERYLTGAELKNLFSGQYLSSGRHHSVVLGISIPEYLYFLGIDDILTYRIFINQFFCRIMKSDTDKLLSFFGYNSPESIHISINPKSICLEKYCSICGASMQFKKGKYGEFLGCSQYPSCKHTIKIPIIGNC